VSREAEILLAKIDEFAAELAQFRAELVALIPPAAANGADEADDFAPYRQIDGASAQSRFNVAQDTLRAWARAT
jgi:hypothetical protein